MSHYEPQLADRMELEDYIELCRAEAERQWCYAELVEDHKERVAQAFDLSEDPAEFIQWLGEKYDLISRSEWDGW